MDSRMLSIPASGTNLSYLFEKPYGINN